MITAGIHCGTKNTKTVIMEGGKILGKGSVLTGFDQKKAVEDSLEKAIQAAGISKYDIERVFGTGSGKNSVKMATETVNEIKVMAERIYSLVERIGVKPEFAVTGRMAKNRGVMNRVMFRVGLVRMSTEWDAQIAGAVGAALFAYTLCQKGKAKKKL